MGEIQRVENIVVGGHPVASEEHLAHTEARAFSEPIGFIEEWLGLTRVAPAVRERDKRHGTDQCGDKKGDAARSATWRPARTFEQIAASDSSRIWREMRQR